MKNLTRIITFLILISIILSACTPAATESTPEASTESALETEIIETPFVATEPVETPEDQGEVLYINLTWHQHQPLYYKDEAGVYTRPWVRVHATKDYLDMAEKVAVNENVFVTFNLTPTLIRQLNDFANGAKDIYWVLAEKAVSELSETEKRFILERFFDANWTNIIARYPRYQELLDKRGGADEKSIGNALESFSDQDFLDLQIWFNLAWFDPEYLAAEPLRSLVEKDRDFSEDDKVILFDQVLEIIQKVIPFHKELQDKGQIEITTTPYAHPILPLIYDNQLALVGNPSAEMPEMAFSYPQDAEAHLDLSVAMYEEIFSREVRGLWPGEGAVAQDIVSLVSTAGFTFMQTGEPVLAKSLGIDSFTRDSQGIVQEADDLYRPYYVRDDRGNQVGIFFRDWTLSDNIGFTYSGMSGEEGAADLIHRLEAIQSYFTENDIEGPHIVSIIVDGENAWEHYPNDGNEFLNAFYLQLSESNVLQTITPSEYLGMAPEQRSIEDLFPGAWFSPNYDTWIGEPEEAIAWDYLAKVRQDLEAYETGESTASAEAIAEAFDYMYLAEGSDWFWWYGADQDSGQDSYFDEGFRSLLTGVYDSLAIEAPRILEVPIIQALPVKATDPFRDISTPEIDGEADDAWDTAAYYRAPTKLAIKGFYVTLDKDNLYLRADVNDTLAGKQLEFYFNVPGSETGRYAFTDQSEEMIGFYANNLVRWDGGAGINYYSASDDGWEIIESGIGKAKLGEETLEISMPLSYFGTLAAGKSLKFTVVIEPDGKRLPVAGPAQLLIPDLGEKTVVLEVQDAVGDDFGPGTYSYPQDGVFKESVFDAQSFSVGYDALNLVLTFNFVGPIENTWGSPNGLSVQTLDVYIDTDPGEGTGARHLLPGRNAVLTEGFGWEYAVWAEGWTPQVLQADPETFEPKVNSEATSGMTVIVDDARNAVIIRVPMNYLPEGDPSSWAYAAAVLSQEGYPTEGVWRVRNIEQVSAQWAFGGAPMDVNHTRIIDLILPVDGVYDQVEVLSNYPSSLGPLESLSLSDFAQIPMIWVK